MPNLGLPGNELDLNKLPTRRELPPIEPDVCDGRTDDGRIIRALPLGRVGVDDAALGFNEFVRKRENRFDPLANAGAFVVDVAACGALLERLAPPLKRRVLSALPMAGVAVIVGVKSLLEIIVALLATKFLRFGLNVGRFLDANGRISGVNVFFFAANVKRDFLRPFSSVSSSFSPFSLSLSSSSSFSFSPSSCSDCESLIELSTTADVGLITAAVGFTFGKLVADGAILATYVLSIT